MSPLFFHLSGRFQLMLTKRSVILDPIQIQQRADLLGFHSKTELKKHVENFQDDYSSAEFVYRAFQGKPISLRKANVLAKALKLDSYETLLPDQDSSPWLNLLQFFEPGLLKMHLKRHQYGAGMNFFELEDDSDYDPMEREDLDEIYTDDKWYLSCDIPKEYQLMLIAFDGKQPQLLLPGKYFPETITPHSPFEFRRSNKFFKFSETQNIKKPEERKIVLLAAEQRFYAPSRYLMSGSVIDRNTLEILARKLLTLEPKERRISFYEFLLCPKK